MDRREVMKSLATMFGAELLLPIKIAISQNFDPIDFSGGTLFSELQKNQVDISENFRGYSPTPKKLKKQGFRSQFGRENSRIHDPLEK